MVQFQRFYNRFLFQFVFADNLSFGLIYRNAKEKQNNSISFIVSIKCNISLTVVGSISNEKEIQKSLNFFIDNFERQVLMLHPGVNGSTLHYVKSEEKDRKARKRKKDRQRGKMTERQKDKNTERLKDRKV
jgi:hypothetical protein